MITEGYCGFLTHSQTHLQFFKDRSDTNENNANQTVSCQTQLKKEVWRSINAHHIYTRL